MSGRSTRGRGRRGGIRGVDILVSNAGIQFVHPVESFPFPEWKKILAVHSMAHF